MAEIDPAMVSRLFGSKEAVFTEIANAAFSLEPAFDGPNFRTQAAKRAREGHEGEV